jgi:tRNA pseudouridine55 synthase
VSAPAGFVLPVDKPEGPTSHDVVGSARRALGERRVGHSGTLDPFASGLLLLCVGRATRLSEYLTGLDKAYEAKAVLGVATDTLDRDGAVVARSDAWHMLDAAAVSSALDAFRGDIQQVPPQYSAKKVEGIAMHRRARRGEHVELEPCTVTIHDIALTGFEAPEVRFRVRCSSGTYVRALARDLGESLGVGAHLTGLRRTSIGTFDVADAVALAALDDATAVARARISPAEALAHLPSLRVEEATARRLAQGQRVRLDDAPDGALVAVLDPTGLCAVAEVAGGVVRPQKVFAS